MKHISVYDERQLKLMQESLSSFEKKQIELNFLISNLEFLFSVLESVDEDWEDKFLTEITALETINATNIIRHCGENIPEIEAEKKQMLINKSVFNLNKLIKNPILRMID